MHEWNIDGRYLSAIVAVVTAGILYFEVIEGTYYSHVEVEAFLERLRSFLLPNAVALFDSASIQLMESTLQLVDAVFAGR